MVFKADRKYRLLKNIIDKFFNKKVKEKPIIKPILKNHLEFALIDVCRTDNRLITYCNSIAVAKDFELNMVVQELTIEAKQRFENIDVEAAIQHQIEFTNNFNHEY